VTKLADILRRVIDTHGPLDIGQFMALCAAHRGAGYYHRRETIGLAGDFVTAPEISQTFGEMLGLALAAFWQESDRPRPIALAELGPGRGTLMADLWRATAGVSGFHEAVRGVHLVEISGSLRQLQQQALRGLPLVFHEDIAELPRDLPLYLVANEFFDSLPMRQFVRTARGLQERRVTADASGRLAFVLDPRVLPSSALDSVGLDAEKAQEGAVIEIAPAREAMIADLAARIAVQGGLAYVIDYGFDRPQWGDTLQAVARHRRVEPLAMPGEADLSSHVDFAALLRATAGSGTRRFGPLAQGTFLRRLGIETRLAALLARATPEQAAELRGGVARLTTPEAMGALFRVLAMTGPQGGVPPGFEKDEEAG